MQSGNLKQGHVIFVIAPMASGKGSLIKHIFQMFPSVTHTVSCTTRAPRPGETEGKDYYFVSPAEFEHRIAEGRFVEWATFGGNMYGTLRSELMNRLEDGQVVICEIEIQGVLQLLPQLPEDKRTIIYIEAGEWETLKARAIARAPITEDELALRYDRYCEECAYKHLANVVIENRDGMLVEAQAHIERVVRDIIERTQ